MTPLKLYHLGPSPNCIKARVALGYKGVPYEPIGVDPQDRASVVRGTGQPLTPAIEHGQVKLFDSGAILRYVDANFAGPQLFAEDRDTMREIENWEWHARAGMRDSLGAVYTMAFGGVESTRDNIAGIYGELEREADRVQARLDEAGGWLAAGRLTAADITMAAIFAYVVGLENPHLTGPPIGAFVREHFTLGESHATLRDWTGTVLSHDAWLQPHAAV